MQFDNLYFFNKKLLKKEVKYPNIPYELIIDILNCKKI